MLVLENIILTLHNYTIKNSVCFENKPCKLFEIVCIKLHPFVNDNNCHYHVLINLNLYGKKPDTRAHDVVTAVIAPLHQINGTAIIK